MSVKYSSDSPIDINFVDSELIIAAVAFTIVEKDPCIPAFKMFRRQVLRQSRSVSQSPKQLSYASAPFSQWTPPQHITRSAAIPSRLGRRWQSTDAAETQQEPAADTTPANGKSTETPKEDPLKQELEKKNKEVVDLKVCTGLART